MLAKTHAPKEEDIKWPVCWTVEHLPSKDSDTSKTGKVFGCVIGHYDSLFDDEHFQKLILQGIDWCLE